MWGAPKILKAAVSQVSSGFLTPAMTPICVSAAALLVRVLSMAARSAAKCGHAPRVGRGRSDGPRC